MVRRAINDTIASKIDAAQAKLEALKAKAETAKANAELEVIVGLLKSGREIYKTLNELKTSTGITYQQAKSDVDSRIAELEKSVQSIEVKFKAA